VSVPERPAGDLVRPEAAEALRGPPAELERLIRITSPRSWIALLGLVTIVLAALLYMFFGAAPVRVEGSGIILPVTGIHELQAPQAGTLTRVRARTGTRFARGQVLAELRTTGGRTIPLRATSGGRIVEVLAGDGEVVAAGARVLNYNPPAVVPREIVAFVPASDGKRVERGMTAHISPATAPSEQYGSIVGRVSYVSVFPASRTRISLLLGGSGPSAVSDLAGGSVLEVHVRPNRDPSTPNGYGWTSGDGPSFPIQIGTDAAVSIEIEESRPVERLFS
jgi:hypothetical protein